MQNLHLYYEDGSSISLHLAFRKEVRIEPTGTPKRRACVHRGPSGTFDTDEAARIAVCSACQLKRTFPYLAEITLSEYVRCRAMTRATQDLLATHEKVIDIALRYGYESPTTF